jgi:hypothetical protein
MPIALKWASTLVLAAVLAFCVYGYLASSESPTPLVFQRLYGAGAVGCALAVAAVWFVGGTRR